MANFEGLIRQALASQNASDPAIRQRVYQSSRNALYKMLEKTGNTDDAVVAAQAERLESSIRSIEAEYAPPAAPIPEEPAPVEMPPEPQTQAEPPAREPAPTPEPSAASLSPDSPSVPEQVETYQRADETPRLPPDYTPEPMFPPVETPPPQQTYHEPVAELQPPQRPTEEVVPASPGIDTTLPPRDAEIPQPDYRPAPEPDFGSAAEPRLPDPAPPQQPPPSRPQPISPPGYDDPAPELMLDEYAGQPGQATADTFVAEREPAPVYRRRNPLLRRIWPIALALAVLLVILWILYALFSLNDDSSGAGSANGDAAQGSEDGTIITLLRPTDLSALVTAGRGTAEIISELNQQMLRLKSVRQGTASGGNAEPILLELERGVLRQIAGKQVTVEFYSKSGGTGPAQFAVQCDVGGDSVCGRKRFRVGLQPERSIFSLDIPQNVSTDQPAYLAINTDVTNAADASGSGDVIDIIHVRLILDE